MDKFVATSIILLALSVSARLCWCQGCTHEFETEPDTVSGTTITCNILGARVETRCQISGNVEIGWFYTTDRGRAGAGVIDDQIEDGTLLYLIQEKSTPTASNSSLIIRSYNSTYEGFYWCGPVVVPDIDPSLSFNPSRVVHLRTTFTTAELASCPSTITLTRDGRRCAYGDEESQPSIVVGAEFTDIIITTTPEMLTTTEEVTTAETTEMDVTTATPTSTPRRPGPEETTTKLEGTDGSSSSVVRTALIWFSVGAAVFILLTCGVIICVIALIKC